VDSFATIRLAFKKPHPTAIFLLLLELEEEEEEEE
jgi:hypothetical protein